MLLSMSSSFRQMTNCNVEVLVGNISFKTHCLKHSTTVLTLQHLVPTKRSCHNTSINLQLKVASLFKYVRPF